MVINRLLIPHQRRCSCMDKSTSFPGSLFFPLPGARERERERDMVDQFLRFLEGLGLQGVESKVSIQPNLR